MLTGGKSPRNDAEVKAFFAWEQRCQQIMNDHYQSRGHLIQTRVGTRQYDLILAIGEYEDRVEEKFREGVYGDLLIELGQNIVKAESGWFYHTACDHLHYVFCAGGVPQFYYRIHWSQFKHWLLFSYLTAKSFPKCQISTRGYGLSLNLVVPLKDIPTQLIQRIEIKKESQS